MKRTTGMVLGKFYPPTLGHQYLVDFARSYVDHLTVIVGTLKRETIPGVIRFEWMKEMFPGVNVVHLIDENPQYPEEHQDFWKIWHASIRKFIPEGPDYVFASEHYGFKLAEVMGSKYVPVDHARELVPVSATMIRENPMANWDYLPQCVRPYYVRKVCVIGPESTGKTTLAARLAAHFKTRMVSEYARMLIDLMKGDISSDTFSLFVKGQAASEAALARQANRVLICDSDAFTTSLYHELYFGGCPEGIRQAAEASGYDLYLLAYPDTPYVEDPQRKHPEQRKWFYDRCEAWLTQRRARYVVVRGDWETRFETAREAVGGLIAEELK